jgi:hypothetical protein
MGLFGKPGQKTLDKRLMRAIEYRDFKKMKAAIEAGADIHAPKDLYSTPLFRCVDYSFEEGLDYLLELGVSPDAKSAESYQHPVIRAAEYGRQNMLEKLLDHGANVNAQRDYDGRTALHVAAAAGLGGMVRYLLSKGADAAIGDQQLNTPADLAEKEYPALANLIRGKDAKDEAPVPPPATGWSLTAPDEVAHVADKPAIGYRVTETFNFSARLYTRVTRNLETNAESQSVSGFSTLSEGTLLDIAQEAFTRLGGKMPPENGLSAGKPKLQIPHPGGM